MSETPRPQPTSCPEESTEEYQHLPFEKVGTIRVRYSEPKPLPVRTFTWEDVE